ncbi:hypothetical protein CLV84_1965 [Neolewinella xylanilytica]|uniref:Uncharacterized protein n=1 Tax=Neolewinella xylanilytica TaxID=1514080 RepID=A0A2S6I1N2_9BACT|nr:hypothetical protein [Neolewinella xylanilytica]PPK85074.1 hypothetical protein CLV84_1965 [Neolewinella xylanilytica]
MNATPSNVLQAGSLFTHLLDHRAAFDRSGLQQFGFSEAEINQAELIHGRLAALAEHEKSTQRQLTRLQEESAIGTFDLIKDLKASLKDTMEESRSVQGLARWMFGLTFCLGFALIVVAIYFGTRGQEVLSVAFGTFGMASIVALFISDPPLKVQDSRSNYAQLTIGVLAWFNDLVDKSAIHQINQQVYAVLYNSATDADTILRAHQRATESYLAISSAQMDNTAKVLRLLEEVAEPTNRPKPKPAGEAAR